MNEKLCIACHITKPVAEFYRNSGHRDGLSSRCIPCTREEMAVRWRAKHPEPPPYQRPTEKHCKKCGQTKPLEEFYPHNRTRDGVQYWCKDCQKKAIVSGYRNDPKKHAAYNREWGKKNTAKKADWHLRWRTGLPVGTYDKMLAKQNGRCAICGLPPENGTRLHVDHCHDTGAIRGLLCGKCNTGIGQLLHSEEILLAAIEYIRLSKPK